MGGLGINWYITFMVKPYYLYGFSIDCISDQFAIWLMDLLHLWLEIITFMVTITFMARITFVVSSYYNHGITFIVFFTFIGNTAVTPIKR